MLLASEETYRNLSSFESVDQLNESIRKHSANLTGTMAAVLDVLSRHSCKYPGVSFLTKTNIGKLVGKSRRTIIRVCQRLEEQGIIRQYEMKRSSDMQQTSNAIVILPVKICDVAQNQAPVTQAPSENVTPINSPSLSNQPLLHNTSTSPYVRFKQLIADKKLRNKIYGIWLAHTSYLKNVYDADVLLNVGVTAVMTTFKADKVRNAAGYYNGVLDRMLDKLYFAEVHYA
jgi:DNA-binding Lrp family transcriptional regulator